MKTALETKIKNQTSPMLVIPLLTHRSISSRFLVFRSAEKNDCIQDNRQLVWNFQQVNDFLQPWNERSRTIVFATKHLLP